MTVIVMCPKQKQNANLSQVEIKKFIVWGRNLPRTNFTKSETQNIFAKKQQNENTPPQNGALTYFLSENKFLLCIFINDDNLQIIKY